MIKVKKDKNFEILTEIEKTKLELFKVKQEYNTVMRSELNIYSQKYISQIVDYKQEEQNKLLDALILSDCRLMIKYPKQNNFANLTKRSNKELLHALETFIQFPQLDHEADKVRKELGKRIAKIES